MCKSAPLSKLVPKCLASRIGECVQGKGLVIFYCSLYTCMYVYTCIHTCIVLQWKWQILVHVYHVAVYCMLRGFEILAMFTVDPVERK